MSHFLDHPYRVDGAGRTAMTDDVHAHARQMIEAVLFTAPGERVMRPEFGAGVLDILFDANSVALETASDFLIRSSLQQFLGDVISIDDVTITRDVGRLDITLTYGLRGQDARVTDTFVRRV